MIKYLPVLTLVCIVLTLACVRLLPTTAIAQTPSIASVSPDPYMPGRTTFTITGTGFETGARVTIRSSSFDEPEITLGAPKVEVVSPQEISVSMRAGGDLEHGLDGNGATFAVRNLLSEPSNAVTITARPLTMHLVFHTHLDIGYSAPPSVVAEGYKEFYDRVVEMIENDDAPDEDTRVRFTVETLWQIEQFIARSTPQEVARFFDLVHEGRIEVCAGYNTPNTSAIGHEDLGRLFYPAAKFRARYGIPIQTLILNDQPGYGWGVADAAAASGIRYFLTGINIMDGTSIGGHPFHIDHVPFYWVGRTGDRLLTWPSIGEVMRPDPCEDPTEVLRNGAYAEATADYNMFLLEPWLGSFTDPLWDDEHVLNRVLKGLGYFADRDYACEDILVMAANADNNCDYGLFDDYDMEPFDVFLAMTLAARQINSEVENPHIVITTPSTFFRMIEEKYTGFPDLPAADSGHGGDWPSHWESADVVAPRSTARMRAARRLAPAVEKLSCLNQVIGSKAPYPTNDLAELWRLIRVWDGHTAIAHIPNDELPWLDWDDALLHDTEHVEFASEAYSIAQRLADEQTNILGEQIAGRERTRVVVYNPVGWPRTDLVSATLPCSGTFELIDLETGESVAYQPSVRHSGSVLFLARNVPANGYRVYKVSPSESPPDFEGDIELDLAARRLENAFYRISLDDDGFPVEIMDKTMESDVIDHEAPFRFLKLAGMNLLAEGLNGFHLDSIPHTEPELPAGELRVGEFGPVAASLLITRSHSPITRIEIRLLEGIRRIDVNVTIDPDRLDPIEHWGSHRTDWHVTFPFALDTAALAMRVDTASGYIDPFTDHIPESYNDVMYVTDGLWMADGNVSVEWGAAEPFIVDMPTSAGLIGRVAGMADGFEHPPFATLLSHFFSDHRWDLVTYADGPPDEPGDQDPTTDGYQAYPVLEPGAEGMVTLSYRFRTLDYSGFDAAETTRFLGAANNPLLTVVVPPDKSPGNSDHVPLPPSASLIKVDALNVEVTGFKRSRSGGDFIVRLRELAGTGCTVTISSDLFDITSARRVNLVEEPDDSLKPVSVEGGAARLEVRPHEMAAVLIPAPRVYLPLILRSLALATDHGCCSSYSFVAPGSLRSRQPLSFPLASRCCACRC
jgi:hypothetical protein